MNKARILTIFVFALIALGFASIDAHAYSGFPARDYPYNQYGYEMRYYNGPWGERMVYGAYGYFPNWNGNYPYGYRTYGYMYTPWDLRYGRTMSYNRW